MNAEYGAAKAECTTRRVPGALCRERRSSFIIHHSSFRPAFTLVELMVSLAILVGMMTMVAMIFHTAGKASGEAQASAALYRQLSQITEIIRRDLESVDPLSHMLGIAGVEFLAQEQAQASPTAHRADVLMLVAAREFAPYVYQPASGDEFSPITHIIYEHANFGRLDPGSATWMAGSQRQVESGTIPASQWHLARRVVGFPSADLANTGTDFVRCWPLTGHEFTGDFRERPEEYNKFMDVFDFRWFTDLHSPGYIRPPSPAPDSFDDLLDPAFHGVEPGLFQYNASGALFFAYLKTSNGIFRFDFAGTYLFDGGYWWKWDNGNPDGRWQWQRWDQSIGPDPVAHTPDPTLPPIPAIDGYVNSDPRQPWRHWPEWFYTGGQSRVWLDPSPPAGVPERLAAYFLPACSEFKVEFTYDDPHEIEIGGDPPEPILTPYGMSQVPAPRPVRWQSVPPGEQWVWSGLSMDPGDYDAPSGDLRDLTHPYRWPRALRITIRAYDAAGGLDRPIQRTIIHTW